MIAEMIRKHQEQKHRYHGTVTAIRKTKSGHTILQLDGKTEYMLVGAHEAVKPDMQPFDNIMYTKLPAPTKLPFKKETVTFNRESIYIVTVQLSDKALNRVRREKPKPVAPVKVVKKAQDQVSDELIDVYRDQLKRGIHGPAV